MTKQYSFMVFALKKQDKSDTDNTGADNGNKTEKKEAGQAETTKPDKEREKKEATPENSKEKKKTEHPDNKKPAKEDKESDRDPAKIFRKKWQKSVEKVRSSYGRGISEYRFKFKPLSDSLKKEIVHINFVIDAETVISKIIVAKADGDIIETEILKIEHINRDIAAETFDFEIPEDAEVKHLME